MNATDEKRLRFYLTTLTMAAVSGTKVDLAKATNQVIELVNVFVERAGVSSAQPPGDGK